MQVQGRLDLIQFLRCKLILALYWFQKIDQLQAINWNTYNMNSYYLCLCSQSQKVCLEAHMEENCRQHLSMLCGVVTKQNQQINGLRNALTKLSLDHSGNIEIKRACIV